MQRSAKGMLDVSSSAAASIDQPLPPQRKLKLDRTMFAILVQLLETPLISSTDLAALLALPRRTALRRLGVLEDAPYRVVTHWTPGCLGRGNAQLYLLTERGRAVLSGPQTTGATRRAEYYEAIARASGAHPLSLLRLAPRLPAIVAAQQICTDLLAAATAMLASAPDPNHGVMTITMRRWLRFPRYERQVGWLAHPLKLSFDGVLFLCCRANHITSAIASNGSLDRTGGNLRASEDRRQKQEWRFATSVWLDDGESDLEQITAQFWRLLTYRQEEQIVSELFPRLVIVTQSWERTDIWQAAVRAACAKSGGWAPEGIIVEGSASPLSPASPWPLTVQGTPLGMDPYGPGDAMDNSGVADEAVDAPLIIDLATGKDTSLGSVFATPCDSGLWTAWQRPTTTACTITTTAPRSVSPVQSSAHLTARSTAAHSAKPVSSSSQSATGRRASDPRAERLMRPREHNGQSETASQATEQPTRSAYPSLPSLLSLPALLNATTGLLAHCWTWADDLPTAAGHWSQTIREVFGRAVADLTTPMAAPRTSLSDTEATPRTVSPKSIEPTELPDQWETLTPLRRQLALCSMLLQIQRRHLEILALMGVAPLISTADSAFWLQCSEATIRRRVRDLRALGLCDELLLPALSAGLPSVDSHHIEYEAPTCLRLRHAGRALLAALYGHAAHRTPFKLRDIATPTAHDTGIHRFHSLLAIASLQRMAQQRASIGSIGSIGSISNWRCDEEHCALSLEAADGVTSPSGVPRGRRVVPDAIGEWRWFDPRGGEYRVTFWLEWDTGTEGEAKMRNKLERYATYVQQEQVKHWADAASATYHSPPLLFVVPETGRETWLASVVRDIIAHWESWQHNQVCETEGLLTVQPYPLAVYCTTIAHLAQEGPLGDIWLRVAPDALSHEALLALQVESTKTDPSHRNNQVAEMQAQDGASRSVSSQPGRSYSRYAKSLAHRLNEVWATLTDFQHRERIIQRSVIQQPEAHKQSPALTEPRRCCPLKVVSEQK